MGTLKQLKSIATDAVVLPTAADLCRRKSEELDAARQKHAAIVARIIKIEQTQQRRTGDTDALKRERKESLARIARLERETELLDYQRQADKPKAPLTPQRTSLGGCVRYTAISRKVAGRNRRRD